MLWDVFISHASEDKIEVARPLAEALQRAGLRIWLDENELRLGNSLREKIDEGLRESRFGVVILSPAFFAKRWPQIELNALFSRSNAILPVWHRLRATDVAEKAITLADIVAASTADGLDTVASKILQAIGSPTADRAYRSDLAVSPDRLVRALQVLDHLGKETTWPHLAIQAPGYPAVGWMGSRSATLIEILYAFAAPVFQYKQMSYDARRNFALLDSTARLGFTLMECAAATICSDDVLAATEPAIEYTPRVPGWRLKRVTNPQRYWWQGISEERLRDAMPFFIRGKTGDDDDPLAPADVFHATYERIYDSGDERLQQPLGLLANGLYGFTPATRPVLWRVCVTLALLYSAATGNTIFDPERNTPAEAHKLFQPKDASVFPFAYEESAPLFEEYGATLGAATRYLEAVCVPRVRTSLSAAREQA